MRRVVVCGFNLKASKDIFYDVSGSPFVTETPERKAIGKYVSISKPEAKRLVQFIFGPNAKVPRTNQATRLCDDQYLENVSGSFQVNRRASGDFRGLRATRRKRRR